MWWCECSMLLQLLIKTFNPPNQKKPKTCIDNCANTTCLIVSERRTCITNNINSHRAVWHVKNREQAKEMVEQEMQRSILLRLSFARPAKWNDAELIARETTKLAKLMVEHQPFLMILKGRMDSGSPVAGTNITVQVIAQWQWQP